LANFARVMRGESDGYSIDKRWIRKDGQVVESTISVRCMRLEDGSVDYFVALLQDVTARKRAEEALAKANTELEQRVSERTAQLTALNEELRNEIAERRRAETESLALKDTLAGELAAMTRLHEFSTRLPASTELSPLLQEILAAVISMQHAEFGSVQLYNPETGQLELVGEAGFPPERLDHFASVRDDGPACSRALRQRRRVVIEDVETDPGFAPHRKTAAACGFRAIQSTPLFSRRGEPLGVLSTNFRRPHRPSEHELRMTDLYAVHAAVMIERKRGETALLRYQQELQALNARLIEVQEMESKRLARELHDAFSQKLAVLGMEMGAMARRTSESIPEVSGRLFDFTAEIGTLTKDIHRVSRQLHPAILDDLGLAAALRNECAAFSEQFGIPAEFDPAHVPAELPDDVSLCLYRVAQECLRNVSKHANATRVRVRLTSDDNGIAMEIADTGDGFDPEAIKGKGGLGLISMEERVRLVNGNIAVRAQLGKGVLVRVCAPLRRNRS
jgi:signal transduction histidine kinase